MRKKGKGLKSIMSYTFGVLKRIKKRPQNKCNSKRQNKKNNMKQNVERQKHKAAKANKPILLRKKSKRQNKICFKQPYTWLQICSQTYYI